MPNLDPTSFLFVKARELVVAGDCGNYRAGKIGLVPGSQYFSDYPAYRNLKHPTGIASPIPFALTPVSHLNQRCPRTSQFI